jgi:hypothetical protein
LIKIDKKVIQPNERVAPPIIKVCFSKRGFNIPIPIMKGETIKILFRIGNTGSSENEKIITG